MKKERSWKKRGLAWLLALAMLCTVDAGGTTAVKAAQATEENQGGREAAGDPVSLTGENVALKATAGADYSNTDVGNVNNGYLATKDITSWNTWKNGGASYPAPVWLEWPVSYELTGMRVVWWADSANISGEDNVTFPKSCTVEYLDDAGEWQKITGMTNEAGETADEVGVLYNSSDGNGLNGANKQWNTVVFPVAVKTKKLRLLIERNGTKNNGVGISEWEAYGSKSGDAELTNIAREATVKADYSNTGSSTANVNDGKLAGNAESRSTWNTWKNPGLTYPYPIEMEWKRARKLAGMKVMWWADDDHIGDSMDGVVFPKSCEAYYWDQQTNDWVKITGMTDENGADTDTVGVKYGSEEAAAESASGYLQEKNRYWNEVTFAEQIETKKVRLMIDKPEGASTHAGVGIGEWEVYGEYVENSVVNGVNIAPRARAAAEYANTNTSADKVNNMELAGNSGTTWNTWKNEGDLQYPQPITLTWEEPYDISSMRVMWWADDLEAGTAGGDGVLYPESCEAWYFDYETNDWVKIADMEDEAGEAVSAVGVAGEGTQGNNRIWNGVIFNVPVKTTKLQLRVSRPANATASGGIGIGEWEVYGKEITDEFVAAKITGKNRLISSETSTYYAGSIPDGLADAFTYEWSAADGAEGVLQIEGSANAKEVSVKAIGKGTASIHLKMTSGNVVRETDFQVAVDEITGVEEYVTTTTPGKAPILPDTVAAEGITFDDPTPSLKSGTKPDFDFAETFDSKLMPVTWDEVPESAYGTVGNTFTVEGTLQNSDRKVTAKVTVAEAAEAAVENSTVTFENVSLTDDFWLPKQKINALNSLNTAVYRIGLASGGEPNFDNAIKKLNGEPYEPFSGLVFQDTDIYKTLEAISYTLSVIGDGAGDPEIAAQKAKLEAVLERWITKIEKVQYADGYINTHFTLRSQIYEGGRAPGTHRWRNMSNHEMYNTGHFLESVVAYTRYREGIGRPDYRLYVAGRRFADHIVERFGPNGTRHEVPGHEEIELALVKFAKLVEEYEGAGAGDKYVATAKTLIDRRGEDYTLRESGYRGYQDGQRQYSQDAKPFVEETNAVGHAVRAAYLYTGATDVARLLPEDDPDKEAYLNILDTIWDSVANRKTYITGGIGVASHGEDFGGDYELPNNDSYNEICASIALTNWNQRMNLIHEDAKYADVMERALYNGILVGTNLDGTKFYYANKLEIPKKGGSTDGGMYGGVQRQDWFTCACCPPNLMRTIAKLSEYMYTTHGDNVFVNLYIGSDGNLNVGGTNVGLVQQTEYPWDGAVTITVNPAQTKAFTMNIRIPGWVKEQDNQKVSIKVVRGTDEEVIAAEETKGYVAITREWRQGDKIVIDMPMEIRETEANPNVTTNAGKVAIERGPIVYALEKAGNAQINGDIADFDPRNFVIPRDSELTAEYKEDLLRGVVEISGDVQYKKSDTETVAAKLQAVPFYASNNRGDTDQIQANGKSTRMTVWTNAVGERPVRYVVSFDANGGRLDQSSKTLNADSAMGTLPVPERAGYRFLGWYTAKEGGEQVTEDTVVTESVTIYARWEEKADAVVYQITLDANGGTATVSVIEKEKDQKIGALPTPVRNGYQFLGWYTAKEDGEQVTEDTVVTKDMTIYALWEENVSVTMYTVTLDANGGTSAVTSIEKKAGDAIGELPVPKKDGHTFKGWYTEKEGGEAVTKDTAVTKDMTIYARWEQTGTPEEPKKEQGALTIVCAGFTYDGRTTPSPAVADTTNTGAEVTYTYYTDEACTKVTEAPVNAGTYYVIGTAEETEKYTKAVSAAVKFVIAPKDGQKLAVTGIADQTYTGKEITLAALKVEGCQAGADYDVAYKNNIAVGTATVTITFKGNYTGTITRTFQIKKADSAKPVPKKGKAVSVKNAKYKVTKSAAKNGTVEFKAPKTKKYTSMSIPAIVKIDGYTFKVTSIASNAFKDNTKLKAVTIGQNVTKIGANAFAGCKKLKKISVKATKLKSVGKNALKGIDKKAVISVPKSKKKAYQKLFKGKGQKKTVKIK